ncbi:MAG TPA: DUF4383 domain-containing protein [Frankiaceae bacterium]|nr:DUF4383 domain-containing protein [Frankiaceae bacterium]
MATEYDGPLDAGRKLALAIGVAYVLVGVLGFFVTGFDNFAKPTDEKLLGIFQLNPLHNIVHLLVGFGGLALYKRRDTAKLYGIALAAAYGLTFAYGLVVAGKDTAANFISLNGADNGLHLVSAIAGVVIVSLVGKAAAAVPSRSAA